MSRRLIVESTGQTEHDAKVTYKLYESDSTNPEIFVDGIQGITVVGPIVKINYFTRGQGTAVAGEGVEERTVACRLVMGADVFFSVVDFLKNIDRDLREKFMIVEEPTQKAEKK